MLRIVLVSCLAASALGQFVDPQNAKILKEQRFNAGDGRFGSAFAQEDGSVFREETSIDGERVGQYSYIGDDGKTYTVKYTAGKDGFRILNGDHVPEGANGLNSAAFNPDISAAPAPQVQAAVPQAAAPRFVQPQQQQPIQTIPDYDYVEADPNFNPFINPHDPTHRNFAHNVNGGNFAPTTPNRPVANQLASVPNCADCAGVNPFVNPFDASHQGGLLAGQFAGARQQPAAPQQPAFAPQQPAFTPQQPAAAFNFATTQAPRRFFPPGQLNLNRFKNGFNFDFSSQ